MLLDIMMAFVIAMMIELLSFGNKVFKQFLICFICISIILIYFISECQIGFIGKIDFEIWILFVILFNNIITIVINKLIKAIKE